MYTALYRSILPGSRRFFSSILPELQKNSNRFPLKQEISGGPMPCARDHAPAYVPRSRCLRPKPWAALRKSTKRTPEIHPDFRRFQQDLPAGRGRDASKPPYPARRFHGYCAISPSSQSTLHVSSIPRIYSETVICSLGAWLLESGSDQRTWMAGRPRIFVQR